MDFKDLTVQLQEPAVKSQQISQSAFTPCICCAVTHFCAHNGGQNRKQNTELLESSNLGQLLAAEIKIMSSFKEERNVMSSRH